MALLATALGVRGTFFGPVTMLVAVGGVYLAARFSPVRFLGNRTRLGDSLLPVVSAVWLSLSVLLWFCSVLHPVMYFDRMTAFIVGVGFTAGYSLSGIRALRTWKRVVCASIFVICVAYFTYVVVFWWWYA